MPKKPEYVSIAETLRAELLAGDYDDQPLPGNAALAERFDVNMKTAGRAIQQLVAEGLVLARPGMRAVAVSPELRAADWPMTGRYARARAAQGLVFGGDVAGDIRKDTVGKKWVGAPVLVAHFLQLDPGTRVFRRASRTYVNDVLTEDTAMYFPASVVEAAPQLEAAERIQVVALIEGAGHVVSRTVNEVRARLASEVEQALFGVDSSAVMIEHGHGTYGADDEPLEAVINIRPAAGNVITFDTFEAPIDNE